MTFEVFTKRMARAADQPYVTIQKRGIIAFNHAAYVALGEPAAVTFLFDRENRVVGFQAAERGQEHSYGVRANAKGTTHMVSGTLFTKHYGIPTEAARRWLGRIDDGGRLTIDLRKTPQDVASAGPAGGAADRRSEKGRGSQRRRAARAASSNDSNP